MISIVMGSDSDLEKLSPAISFLEEHEVSYELSIISAHRCPEEIAKYSKSAKDRGVKVIIAAAGGAAHLAGVIASMTNLPVIAIPISLKNLSGVDSLYSMVQMPSGIPVATMAIDGSKNAAIFACQILALNDEKISEKLDKFRAYMTEVVNKKNEKLQKDGYKNY